MRISQNTIWKYLLLALSIFAFTSMMRPGFFPMHDDLHPMRVREMKACLLDLQIPCRWSPDMGYGYGWPQFHYYPPLPYYVTGIAHLIGLSILDSIKLGYIISIVGSTIGMYLLSRQFFGEKAGIFSAILYTYLPYRAVNIYARGALGESWAMMCFPFVWYYLEAYLRSGKRQHMLGLAVSTTALMLSHLLSTMVIAFFLFAWTLYRLWETRLLFKKRLLGLFTAALLAIGLSAFYVIPSQVESSAANLKSLLMGYFSYYNHYISIDQIFFTSHWGYGASIVSSPEDLSFQIGILHWSLAILALLIVITKPAIERRYKYMIILCTLGWLGYVFLMHPRSFPIWNNIHLLQWLQFPWRILAPIGLITSFAAGAILYKSSLKWPHLLLIITPIIFINYAYFQPKSWQNITDEYKFTGEQWMLQQTTSINDYLPTSAKYPPPERAPSQPYFITGAGEVSNYETGTDWQQFTLNVTQEGQLQLPLFYFPGWQVRINNQLTDIKYDNDLGLITFPVSPGNHQINVKLTNTPIRHISNIITIITITLIIYLYRKKTT